MPEDPRRLARELALQAIYQHDDVTGTESPLDWTEKLEAFLKTGSEDLVVIGHARSLIRGVIALH